MESRLQTIFCRIKKKFVDPQEACSVCRHWDGRGCALNRRRGSRGPTRPRRRPSRSISGLRGGRVIVPPVWEEWPRGAAGQEEAQFEPDLSPDPPGAPLAPDPGPGLSDFELGDPPPGLRGFEEPDEWRDPGLDETTMPWDDPLWDPDGGGPG